MAALAQVGLADRADVPAGELSHGEKRALELAIALAMRAEAAAARRADGRDRPRRDRAARRAAARAERRASILLVEHDMEAVFALADRISVLVYGRILASGTPDAGPRRPAGARRLSRRGDGADARGRAASPPATATRRCCSTSSFTVGAGEVVTLLGRNGMGKTTTIRTHHGPAAGARRHASTLRRRRR